MEVKIVDSEEIKKSGSGNAMDIEDKMYDKLQLWSCSGI